MSYVLEAKNITKIYDGMKALDSVNFKLEAGEVHCLCGENGAGKSTLGKIFAGVRAPDEGQIIIGNKTLTKLTPVKAKAEKIGMVFQEINLMPDLTIAENIYMFEKASFKHSIIDRKIMYKKTVELFNRFELDNFPSPHTKVGSLTIAQQQIIEIIKGIAAENKIMILDEPTASLSTNEVQQLFKIIRQLKQNGVAIILVTHRFKEIFSIGDVITVICDGKLVKERVPVKGLSDEELVKLMVGRDVHEFYGKSQELELGDVIFEVNNISDGKMVNDVSFKLRKNEILGFSGLMGAGRSELAECIMGIRKKKSGKILLNNNEIKIRNVKTAIKNKIGFVTEDRKNSGLFTGLSIFENANIVLYNIFAKFFISDKKYKDNTVKLLKKLNIKTNSLYDLVTNLSGGNQQKVLLLKWLLYDPDIIIFDEPTRGIDVGTKIEIYNLIREIARNGKTIIVISSEMQELIALCNRIIVMCEGSITGEFFSKECTEELLLSKAIRRVD